MLMVGFLEGIGSARGIAARGADSLTIHRFFGAASFPAALNFSDVGLSAVEPGFSGVVGNSAFALRFSMLDSIPAGVLMEVQASRDLGLTDPWHTIGSRSAATGWTGAAIFTTTPATAGKSNVTLTPLLTAPELPKQPFRIRISRY